MADDATEGTPEAAASASVAPAPAKAQTFYRYEDPSGRLVIVDSVDKLPEAQRREAQPLKLAAGDEVTPWARADLTTLHWPSFCYGLVAALLLGLLLRFARGRSRLALGLLALGAIVLGAGLYFGLLRRMTGQGSELLSSPTQILDDAKRQVEAMKKRQQERDLVLDEIKRESK